MTFPEHPLAAATHADPYPYYAQLVAERPLYYHAELKLWVASSAAAVEAVLACELCRVRPSAEPVPTALLGTPAAVIFRQLVRMNDGAGHCPFRQAVTAALAAPQPAQVAALSRAAAGELARRLRPADTREHLSDLTAFLFRLPLQVVAQLLGIADTELPALPARVEALVRCFAPGADAAQIAQGAAAAAALLDVLQTTMAAGPHGVLATLLHEARRVGRDDPVLVAANAVGFLTQTCEASAGLIGNTLLALGAQPGLRQEVAADAVALDAVVQEVLRHDPPVQNTRRFVAADGIVAGREMRAGDTILVLLAAAGRDPAANPDPQRFDPGRSERRIFCFGSGIHACPGARIAAAIAAAGVGQLLAAGVDPARLPDAARYRASQNGRLPLFG